MIVPIGRLIKVTCLASLSALLGLSACNRIVTVETTQFRPTTTTTVEVTTTETVTFTPLITPAPAITREEAFNISKQLVPDNVLMATRIVTVLSWGSPPDHGIWINDFQGLSITKQQLVDFGWRENATTSFGAYEPYIEIKIIIDALTGEAVIKQADRGVVIYPASGYLK
jgi:hypothetical protein